MSGYGPGALLFGEEEVKEVTEVLQTGYLYRYGDADDPAFLKKVLKFEDEMREYFGVPHAIAMNSGSSSLLSALAALGIGPGDEVIVPGYTFIASISAIINARAVPILAEVDDSLTLDPQDIEHRITAHTKAIMPVHMIGNPCKMDEIMDIAKKHGLYVIEDGCQAMGGSYKGQKLGTIGDIGCFSLNRFKPINTGDGGALITKDAELYKRAYAFHDQGHLPMREGVEEGSRTIFGMNFRMHELTAAVALGQFRKIDKLLEIMHKNKKIMKDEIAKVPGAQFRTINDPEECATLLTLKFDTKEKAEEFAKALKTRTVHYSGWHVYDRMEHLLNRSTPTDFKCPFTCPLNAREPEYYKGMLPYTSDLLQRCVTIGIGVSDKGNGAGIGISVLSTEVEVRQMAEKVRTVLAEIL